MSKKSKKNRRMEDLVNFIQQKREQTDILTPEWGKYPKGHFMHWFEEKAISGNKIDFQYKRYDKSKYVSEFITDDEVATWRPNEVVFLSAQTGAGKTSFIPDHIVRRVEAINRKFNKDERVLVISNRVALNRQIKRAVAQKLLEITQAEKYVAAIKKDLTPSGLDGKTDFGLVQIHSYQGITANTITKYDYRYIICDECHFFTSDATFNRNVDSILKSIIYNGGTATRIYISATPEVVFEPIVRKEKKAQKELKKRPHPLVVKYYDMLRDYSYLSVNILDSEDDLVDILASQSERASESKWLIFNNTITNSKELAGKINKKLGIPSVPSDSEDDEALDSETETKDQVSKKNEDNKDFVRVVTINASKKKGKVFTSITDKQCFDCKYLITTSVLDNGVSIRDKKVTNVAIVNIMDRVEILQMLGRIRIEGNAKLNLYIVRQDLGSLYKNARHQLLGVLHSDFEDDRGEVKELEERVAERIGGKSESLSKIFYQKYKKGAGPQYTYNNCLVYYLINRLVAFRRFCSNDDISKYTDKELDVRAEIYKAYLNPTKEEKDKVKNKWRRAIVDLLEYKMELDDRRKSISKFMEANNINGDIDKEYAKSFIFNNNQTFYNFVTKQAAGYYLDELKKKIEHSMKTETFKKLVPPEGTPTECAEYYIDEAQKYYTKNGLSDNTELFTPVLDKIKYYQELSDDGNYGNVDQEIFRWFEKVDDPGTHQALDVPEGEKDVTCAEIVKRALVAISDMAQFKVGSSENTRKTYDVKLKDNHGIKEKSAYDNELAKALDKSKTSLDDFKAEKGKKALIQQYEEYQFIVYSYNYNDKKEKPKFYLLHEVSDLLEHNMIEQCEDGTYTVLQSSPPLGE